MSFAQPVVWKLAGPSCQPTCQEMVFWEGDHFAFCSEACHSSRIGHVLLEKLDALPLNASWAPPNGRGWTGWPNGNILVCGLGRPISIQALPLVITIAHRLTTILDYDRVVVLDQTNIWIASPHAKARCMIIIYIYTHKYKAKCLSLIYREKDSLSTAFACPPRIYLKVFFREMFSGPFLCAIPH